MLTLRQALFTLQATDTVSGLPVTEVIRGWGQYSDVLPPTEQSKIDQLAELIVTSFASPRSTPLGKITIVGHADHDFHGAAFEKKVSDERALTVAASLGIALKKAALARGITTFAGAIAFDPPPHGVGATQPAKDAARDRTKNRRVEIELSPRGAPIPPPPPDPKTETTQRLDRSLDVINRRGMPSGPVQTSRVKCIFEKLRNNPNVKDRFVDGDLTLVRIRGQLVNGLQDINRNYGFLTEEEREVFFEKAKAVVLSVRDFGKDATDDDVIRAADGLDRRILKARGFIDAHLGINGIASDGTKVLLNDEITRLQGDPDSIYSCK
jgi:hypothetical protein